MMTMVQLLHATTYDADLSIVGTGGGTTVTIGMQTLMELGGPATTGVDLASTIGPLTIAADMFNTVLAELQMLMMVTGDPLKLILMIEV